MGLKSEPQPYLALFPARRDSIESLRFDSLLLNRVIYSTLLLLGQDKGDELRQGWLCLLRYTVF